MLMEAARKVVLDSKHSLEAKTLKECRGVLAGVYADRANRWLRRETSQAFAQ